MSVQSAIAPTVSTPYLFNGADFYNASSDATVSDKNIDAVSKDFEAVFLSQMMSQMFSGDSITGFFGGGTSGEVYKSYMLNEYGKVMAQAGGIGIATQVKRELLALQEVHV